MKFRKFKQDKLFRDKIVERLEQSGSNIHWQRLDDEAFAQELKIKFMEEAHEVCSAQTKEALIEELADILEVMNSLAEVHQFTLRDVINAQHKKQLERGGFHGRKFVTVAEHPVGSFGEKYCLADPQKYPEIVE